MKFTLAIFCVLACGTSALAQYGVTNTRDGSGNMVRSGGSNQAKTQQGSVSGPSMNLPAPAPPLNSRKNTGK